MIQWLKIPPYQHWVHANLLSPIFGGMPATGVIARTGANIQNGAQTRVAGLILGSARSLFAQLLRASMSFLVLK